jgi:hypothetical protein
VIDNTSTNVLVTVADGHVGWQDNQAELLATAEANNQSGVVLMVDVTAGEPANGAPDRTQVQYIQEDVGPGSPDTETLGTVVATLDTKRRVLWIDALEVRE